LAEGFFVPLLILLFFFFTVFFFFQNRSLKGFFFWPILTHLPFCPTNPPNDPLHPWIISRSFLKYCLRSRDKGSPTPSLQSIHSFDFR